MTNYEKYKDEILKRGPTGFGKKAGNICDCCDINCSDCYFWGVQSCNTVILDWLFEEYKEGPVLTKQEHLICELLKDGYLMKVKNTTDVNLYYSKINLMHGNKLTDPFKVSGQYAVITTLCNLIGAGFDFIEPNSYYNVKDLRGCAWVDD